MQLLIGARFCVAIFASEERVSPAAVAVQLANNAGHFGTVGGEEPFHEGGRVISVTALLNLSGDRHAEDRQSD